MLQVIAREGNWSVIDWLIDWVSDWVIDQWLLMEVCPKHLERRSRKHAFLKTSMGDRGWAGELSCHLPNRLMLSDQQRLVAYSGCPVPSGNDVVGNKIHLSSFNRKSVLSLECAVDAIELRIAVTVRVRVLCSRCGRSWSYCAVTYCTATHYSSRCDRSNEMAIELQRLSFSTCE